MEKCTRCAGHKKIILFSSVENPCQRCKGSGQEPDPEVEQEDVEEEEEEDYLSILHSFFHQEIRKKLKLDEYYGSVLKQHPSQKLIESFTQGFDKECALRFQGVDPMLLMKADRPRYYYRRAQGESIQFHKLPYLQNSSWNSPPQKGLQPKNSLILLVKDPTPFVHYLIWSP